MSKGAPAAPSKKQKEAQKKLLEVNRLQINREYAAAQKLTEQILKKDPQNHEALAWSGYFNYVTSIKPDKQSCIDKVKQAIRQDLKNANIWRISALLYKEMSDYTNALSAFKTSFRFDSSNITVLNEIIQLNLYEGHYSDFLETARQILQKTHQSFQVARYGIALYLNRHYQTANDYFDKLQKAWTPTTDEDELLYRSEFCIFRGMILIKLEKYSECLSFLNSSSVHIRDSVRSQELCLQCHLGLHDTASAISTLRNLISVYPENGDYFKEFEALIPSSSLIDELLSLKESCHSHYAHVRVLELMPLSDSRWEPLLLEHLQPLLFKGAPSTYLTIQDFDSAKLDKALSIARTLSVPISSIPIVHLLAAHVYGYRGETDAALAELDAGLAHTATCIELIAWKARFLMRAGRVAAALEQARLLRTADPADRNSNLLLVKQLFLAGLRSEAVAEARAFATDDGGGNLLYQVQFNSFYMQFAAASLRCGDYERSKRLYAGVLKHFTDFRKGQFNYLGWASKKPRALIEMIEFVDGLEGDKTFTKAAAKLLQIAMLQKCPEKMKVGTDEIDVKNVALRVMKSRDPEALAWATIVFCALKMYVQAMRCFTKLEGSPQVFVALGWINRMLLEEKNQIVDEVLKEEFKPPAEKPQSSEEMVAAAFGDLSLGQYPEAQKMIEQALEKDPKMPFKKALELFVFVNWLSGADEEFKKRISDMLRNKFTMYEFDVQKENNEDNLDISEVLI